jgi:hypothetical protein
LSFERPLTIGPTEAGLEARESPCRVSPYLYASEITPLALILDAGALHACIDAIGSSPSTATYRSVPTTPR